MSAPHVLAEIKDGIGWLTLNRPESLNALSFEMTDLLIKHTAEFEKDAEGALRGDPRRRHAFHGGRRHQGLPQVADREQGQPISPASRCAW